MSAGSSVCVRSGSCDGDTLSCGGDGCACRCRLEARAAIRHSSTLRTLTLLQHTAQDYRPETKRARYTYASTRSSWRRIRTECHGAPGACRRRRVVTRVPRTRVAMCTHMYIQYREYRAPPRLTSTSTYRCTGDTCIQYRSTTHFSFGIRESNAPGATTTCTGSIRYSTSYRTRLLVQLQSCRSSIYILIPSRKFLLESRTEPLISRETAGAPVREIRNDNFMNPNSLRMASGAMKHDSAMKTGVALISRNVRAKDADPGVSNEFRRFSVRIQY